MAARREAPCKRWCFTLNNYTEEEYTVLKNTMESLCIYGIIGKEVGENGTPHLQGYFNFVRKVRLNQMKAIQPRAHFERSKGSDLENKMYCSKEKNFVEYGQPSCQGQRNDLTVAITCLRENRGDLKRCAEENPETFVKYFRGLTHWAQMVDIVPRRDFKTDVYVIVGPPGTGKSRLAASLYSDNYYKPRGTWWDGYHGQYCVIIDDFYGWMPYDDLLRVTDRYPHKVPFKGGFAEFSSHVIVITSNKIPRDWYTFEKFMPTAMYRRFTFLTYLDFSGPDFNHPMLEEYKYNY